MTQGNVVLKTPHNNKIKGKQKAADEGQVYSQDEVFDYMDKKLKILKEILKIF